MTAILVLGMHRSGTSCLAGMLSAASLASAGETVRNWDNARGHYEMLDAIRLDEAVLAHSGGHWLSPPAAVRWTDEHAAARDRLLSTTIDGLPALLKDPRMLLVLPFWRASRVPMRVIGIVRHPLAVARSLEAWREMPLVDGVALWMAHNRALAADRAQHDYPVIDFEQSKAIVVAAVARAFAIDPALLADAYDEQLVHFDGDASAVAGQGDAVALYHRLGGAAATHRPRVAPLVPRVTACLRRRAFDEALAVIAEAADPGLRALLHGKVLLVMGDAAAAIPHLEAACAVAQPYYQARSLLPQALRAAGRHAEARAALRALVPDTLYPHGPLATLAEWSRLDGDYAAARGELEAAITAAPPHRRGRLRTRLAEWHLADGDHAAARDELARAIVEDPGYTRSRDLLVKLAGSAV